VDGGGHSPHKPSSYKRRKKTIVLTVSILSGKGVQLTVSEYLLNTYEYTDGQTDRQRDRETDMTERQTDRQRDRQTDMTDRQRDRQADTQT